jgi:hypothetical protein
VIFKIIKLFFERKGCRHWLGLGPKIIWACLYPKPKLKGIRKVCVIFKKIKFFFERKGGRHWLGLGPKMIWACLNPKPKLKRIKNFL